MKFGRICALAAAFLATPIWAATLSTADNLDIEVIDGQKFRSGLFSNAQKAINLSEGDHQIVLRLSGSIKGSKDPELYKTGYHVITLKTEGNEKLELASKPIKRMRDARAFDKNPEFILTNSNGKAYPFQTAFLEKEGMQIGRDLVRELKEFNATGSSAALESRAPFAALAMNNPATTLSNGSKSVSEVLLSEQMLHYWFQQADKETRERFLSWAARAMQKQNAAQ